MQADLVFTGGLSYTPDQARRRLGPAAAGPGGPPASAVAVRAGKILAIGAAADRAMAGLIGPALRSCSWAAVCYCLASRMPMSTQHSQA